MLLFYEIYQLFFWLFKTFIRFIKIGLEFGIKVFFRRWSFKSESKHFVFNVFWLELVWLHLLFYLELYQFLFSLCKALIRWRNTVLGFSLKMIFRRCMFIVDNKHFIFNMFWWEHVWFHLLFYFEIYQLFFWLFKTLIISINLGLEFTIKAILRIWSFRSESNLFILNAFWWKPSQFIIVLLFELYQFFFFQNFDHMDKSYPGRFFSKWFS